MEVFSKISEVRAHRGRYLELGLVATMGSLHDGHMALVRQAKAECGAAAASIFVNPTQFAPGGDFDRYPRALESDLAALKAADADFVFAPEALEMYPAGFDARVEVGGVSEGLEGAARPGHFSGVATVVAKLFNIVQPTRAYFGQKDAQQVAVVLKMARDLDSPVQVVVAPTVRAADGVALSSRNRYLDPDERLAARALYRALSAARALFEDGERDGERLRRAMARVLADEPKAAADYVSIADPLTMKELAVVGDQGALASLAARIGAARLIDNLLLGPARLTP